MVIIKYPSENTIVNDWRALLDEIVVAYKMEAISSLKEAILEEDDVKLTGEKAITEYLNDLKQSVEDWRAPGCGI